MEYLKVCLLSANIFLVYYISFTSNSHHLTWWYMMSSCIAPPARYVLNKNINQWVTLYSHPHQQIIAILVVESHLASPKTLGKHPLIFQQPNQPYPQWIGVNRCWLQKKYGLPIGVMVSRCIPGAKIASPPRRSRILVGFWSNYSDLTGLISLKKVLFGREVGPLISGKIQIGEILKFGHHWFYLSWVWNCINFVG